MIHVEFWSVRRVIVKCVASSKRKVRKINRNDMLTQTLLLLVLCWPVCAEQADHKLRDRV